MKKALRRHGSPEAIITDGLRSYGAAMSELGNRNKQDIGRWANNGMENSHLVNRQTYKERRSAALAEWRYLMG